MIRETNIEYSLPERLQPRNELERLGAQHVGDDVLLACILQQGQPAADAAAQAHHLLRRWGTLSALARASAADMQDDIGKGRAAAVVCALELTRRLQQESAGLSPVIRTPEDIARYFRHEARTLDVEQFWCLMLDAKNKIKGVPMVITQGLLDSSMVHPREVFRQAIREGAAAIILAHNHPSGDPTPSGEDIRVTKQLVETGTLIGIKVLDHVVMGAAGSRGLRDFTSIREEGLISFS